MERVQRKEGESMTATFEYKNKSSFARKLCAWILLSLSTGLLLFAFLGLWFWGMLITVLVIAPEAFTELAFAKRFACLLILVAPIMFLIGTWGASLVTEYFDREDFVIWERV